VAEVELAAGGKPRRFSVLQAPDAAISGSVASCVGAFRAGPSVFGKVPLRGKLFYYFVLVRGTPRVFVLNDVSQEAELLREMGRRGK